MFRCWMFDMSSKLFGDNKAFQIDTLHWTVDKYIYTINLTNIKVSSDVCT